MGITGGLVGTAQKKPVADLAPDIRNALNTWMATNTAYVPPTMVDMGKLIKNKRFKKQLDKKIKMKTITVASDEEDGDVVEV